MSSHHFVKEGQEPALFIINPNSLEQIQPLLEWAPFLLVMDSCLDIILSWGVKVDAVLVVQDSIESVKERVADQIPVQVIPGYSSENPILTGMNFLISKKQSAVNVVTDSLTFFSDIEELTNRIEITFLDATFRWVRISNGKYEKWLPAKAKLNLKGDIDKQSFSIYGLDEIGTNVYETSQDQIISIKSTCAFWIGEEF